MVHGLWFHCHQEFPVKKEAGAKKEEIVATGAETEAANKAGDNQTEDAPLAPAAAAAETTGAAAAAETPATAAAAAKTETPATAAPAAAMGSGGSGKPAAHVQKKDEKKEDVQKPKKK